MRIGGPFSLVLHVGIAAAGIAFAPEMMPITSTPTPYIPIDLVTIAEETNLTEVVEATTEEEEAEEVAEEAEAAPAPPPPPPPEPEEVVLPAETPPPKKPAEVAKKPEVKPAPREEEFDSALQDILAAANSAPKKSKETPAKRTDLSKVGEGAPREGFGNRRENTASITAFITQQLRDNGCWGDQDDLAGAQGLKATIRVKFRRDGKFDGAPSLVQPSRMPPQGPFLAYITRAFTALNKCENIGFKVPAEYFQSQPPPYIDIEFLP